MKSAAFNAWVGRARAVRVEDEIARRNITLKRQGKNLVGPCPKCGGDDRFSINPAKGCWNCRRCKTKAIKGDVIGMTMWLDNCGFDIAVETLTHEPPPKANGKAKANGSKRPADAQKVEAEIYTYFDENNLIEFETLRYHFQKPDGSLVLGKNGKPKKIFFQRRPDFGDPDRDVWVWGLGAGEYMRRGPGRDWYQFDEEQWQKLPATRERKTIETAARAIPYRLPELLEAIANGLTIHIVEGEAKADKLAEWNLAATCNAGGAGKWTAEHAAYLSGADVVIHPDNDEPGRKHRDTVGKSLQGIARVRVLELPGLGPSKDVGDWKDAGHTREEFDTLVEKAPDWPDLDKCHGPRDDTQRAVIRVEPGILHELATAGEQALIAAGVPFYAHAEEIKRPVVDEVEATKGRKAKVARFASVTPDALRDWLSRVAIWERFNERKKDYTPTDPPRDVAATILSRSGEWHFPRAVGVITTPTLRPDGTILSIPGYDPVTRMVLTNPPAMPAIPEAPTRNRAIAALQLLNNLLEEFPFTDEPGRAVALSELITPVVRGALTCAPLHANRAPTPGSGKSFLLDIVSAIVSGQPCPVISAGADEFETEKRLGAALLRGQALIAIDNLNGELRGDALCQMIERPIVDVRPLGVSRLVRIESRATLFATGNNLILVGDVVRRVLLCSLDPELERPELRRFRANPFEAVLADRGRYIAAALTIVRAYIAAGCPNTLPALASFEDWSRLVRSALVWLDCADPVDTMETARAEDPELETLRRVIAAWLEAIGPSIPQTAGQLRDLAEMKKSDPDYNGAGTFAHPEFRDALLSIAYGNGGNINAKALGRWLSRYRGRVINGHKISSREDTHRKQVVWTLMQSSEGVCG